MASLSHAPFPTSNTQPVASSPTLLSAHLSMAPSASSSAPPVSSSSAVLAELACLQKPYTKTAFISPMSPFAHPYGCACPFCADFSEAGGESIDQGFAGGDHPLLTSSWEALDMLIAASVPGSAQLPDIASVRAAQTKMSDLSAIADMDQKPLSALYGSLHQKCAAWGGTDHGGHGSTNDPARNVGLNLSTLISADPGFVERAAKFSSYSQQINNPACLSSCHLPNTKTSCLISPTGKSEYDADGRAFDLRKLMSGSSSARAGDQSTKLALFNAASLKSHASKYNHANGSHIVADTSVSTADKQNTSPQASVLSLSGSKKKREELSEDHEVDTKQAKNSKRTKAVSEQEVMQDASNVNGDISPNQSRISSKVHKLSGAGGEKAKQKSVGGSNSGESEQKSEVCNNSKTPSPSPSPSVKADYIHVRARRGQATDSHSLAERVRREKISERMKYLQDLVPGCTKVTGKAMMLDEIINYVQSLQRQVEFLSMKLAAVHPSKLEFNFESLFGKEMIEQPTLLSTRNASIPSSILEAPALLPQNSACFLQDSMQGLKNNISFGEMMSMNPASSAMLLSSLGPDPSLRQPLGMLAASSSDNFGESVSQICNAWVDDDLQNIVPSLPGFAQPSISMHPGLQGTLFNNQMKTEL